MRRAAAAAAAMTAVLVGTAVPAWAHTDPEPVGVVVRHDDGSQSRAIRVSDLYPTATRQVVLLLDGEDRAEARRMRLSVEDLLDRENGCGDPETREGDTTCGDDEGELSGHVEVALTAGREDGGGCTAVGAPVPTTLRYLADDPAVVGLPAGDGVLCVIVDLRHAEGAGDDVTQSDSTRFDLRMEFDAVPVAGGGPGPGADGSGADGSGADGSGSVSIRPASFAPGRVVDLGAGAPGVPIGLPLLLAGLVCGGGALVLLAASRRGAGASL